MDLVKSQQMDPWNINISLLTKKYIEAVKAMQKHDFRLSGKVLLAAALLLKVKSNRLVGQDIEYLDSLFRSTEEDEDVLFEEDLLKEARQLTEEEKMELIPRTPQPRKRKVSIYDLVEALEKALEVKERQLVRRMPPTDLKVPEKGRDISAVIKEIFAKIKNFFTSTPSKKLYFNNLITDNASKQDKVFTFIPLLHLSNHRKIDLEQEQSFGPIEIRQANKENANA
jgi:segregation and condensation protein A